MICGTTKQCTKMNETKFKYVIIHTAFANFPSNIVICRHAAIKLNLLHYLYNNHNYNNYNSSGDDRKLTE